jgi:hypothetical protein
MFILMNIFAYPGLVFDRRTITSMGEITDLRMWADVMRLPFVIALLGVFSGATPLWKNATDAHFAESPRMEGSPASGPLGAFVEAGSAIRQFQLFPR